MTLKFKVSGMSCGHCRGHVAEAITSLPGVKDADINLASGTATVTGDVDPAAVVKAIADAGYTATPIDEPLLPE